MKDGKILAGISVGRLHGGVTDPCSKGCGRILDGINDINPVKDSKIRYNCECDYEDKPDISWEFVSVSQLVTHEDRTRPLSRLNLGRRKSTPRSRNEKVRPSNLSSETTRQPVDQTIGIEQDAIADRSNPTVVPATTPLSATDQAVNSAVPLSPDRTRADLRPSDDLSAEFVPTDSIRTGNSDARQPLSYFKTDVQSQTPWMPFGHSRRFEPLSTSPTSKQQRQVSEKSTLPKNVIICSASPALERTQQTNINNTITSHSNESKALEIENSVTLPESITNHASSILERALNTSGATNQGRPLGIGERIVVCVCMICAASPVCPSTGGNISYASPATLTHFNCHPTRICYQCHPQGISVRYGCSVHRGELDMYGRCYYCQEEIRTGQIIPGQDIRTTFGYPGDDVM